LSRFPVEEHRQRVERAQDLMRARGIDALLLTSRANFDYFTGMEMSQPWAVPTRPQLVIVPREGEPTLVLPEAIAVAVDLDTWIADVRSYVRLDRTDVELIAEVLAGKHLDSATIGLELGVEMRVNLPPADFDALRAALASAELVDAAPLLWQLRLRKSGLEIAEMRRAFRATDAALLTLFSGDRLGWTEREAVRFANSIALQAGADETGFHAVTSGRNEYHRSLAGARDRALQPGDMLWLDLGVRAAGYWSDTCRAAVVGGPSSRQQELQRQIVEATLAGLDLIRPGVSVAEVARETFRRRDGIAGATPIPIGRAGHGIGLSITEPPHVAAYDQTVLEPGMVVTVEPFVADESGMYCAEEVAVVTDNAYELLTSAPRELFTI
jgi:Xaa-Pro aminopeptidase